MTDQMTNEKPAAPAPEPHPETRQSLLLPIVIPLGSFAVIGLVLFGFSRVLLSISASAATAVALIVAVAIMVVAIDRRVAPAAVERHALLDGRRRGGHRDALRRARDRGDRRGRGRGRRGRRS